MKKSGKPSCCADGGSWFGKCGATGNTKLQHTWHEGIHACKERQSKTAVIGVRQSAVQRNSRSSPDSANATNSREATAAAQLMTPTSANSPFLVTTSSNTVFPNSSSRRSLVTQTHSAVDASVSITVSARKFIACNTNAIFDKKNTITIVPSLFKTPTRLQAIPAVYPPITIPVNGPVTPPVDSIITAPGRVPMAESSMHIPPFYTSVSASINVGEYDNVLRVVAQMSISLIIAVC